MDKTPLIPEEFRQGAEQANMSPGIMSGDFVFVTGMTGSDPDGSMPGDHGSQFRNAFEKILAVLEEAGLNFGAVVEMTSYHVGLRDHFEQFDEVRLEYFAKPFPAWTAVEVAGLRRDGAVVEIKVIARKPQ
ncbi:MAG: RidA family protein [Pseudomonadota bacterium]